MAPMLAKTPKQAKYAAGDVTTNTMHRLAASMTTAPMVMVKRAPMRAMRAPMTGAESTLEEYEQGEAQCRATCR